MPYPKKALAGLAVILASFVAARAAVVQGVVHDKLDQPVASARVYLRTTRGSEQETTTTPRGRFQFNDVPPGEYAVVIVAAGFRSQQERFALDAAQSSRDINASLERGGVSDEVVVTASTVDLTLSRTPSSATILDRSILESLSLQSLSDALRYVPGMQVNQTGRRGSSTSVFGRGGESDFNLVLVDGVQVNEFGGNYNFGTVPLDAVERIEVVRGPQTALFGSDAISSVVNIITKKGTASPSLDFVAEGGSFAAGRFAAGGQGVVAGWELAAHASRLDTDGIRPNDDYRNTNVSVNVERTVAAGHNLSFQFLGNDNSVGSPGPFGSDPVHLFGGIDTVSRSDNRSLVYRGSYRGNLSARFRQRVDVGFFDADFVFTSPFGPSTSEHRRASLRSQSDFTATSKDVLSFGFEYERESFLNTYVTDDQFNPFHMRRANYGFFVENLYVPSSRWLLSAGVRLEAIRQDPILSNSGAGRPAFPERNVLAASPRVAVSYTLRTDRSDEVWGKTTLRSSIGRGLRAPSGFELAFTNNPEINPERTTAMDVGVEQTFGRDRARLQTTYYYSRFSDLIVTLGGAAAGLSRYRSDNLSNASGQGLELSGGVSLGAGFSFSGVYTYLHSEVLALDGSRGLAPAPFQVGQPLIRRPAHSGSALLEWRKGRWRGTLDAVARSRVLDIEPNYGASAGLFYGPGYVVGNFGFSYAVVPGVDLYARLNNFNNRKYEESFGYPSLPLNFVAGVRWHLSLSGR